MKKTIKSLLYEVSLLYVDVWPNICIALGAYLLGFSLEHSAGISIIAGAIKSFVFQIKHSEVYLPHSYRRIRKERDEI